MMNYIIDNPIILILITWLLSRVSASVDDSLSNFFRNILGSIYGERRQFIKYTRGEYFLYAYDSAFLRNEKEFLVTIKVTIKLDYFFRLKMKFIEVDQNKSDNSKYNCNGTLKKVSNAIHCDLIGNNRNEILYAIFDGGNEKGFANISMGLLLLTSSGDHNKPTSLRFVMSRKEELSQMEIYSKIGSRDYFTILDDTKLNTDIVHVIKKHCGNYKLYWLNSKFIQTKNPCIVCTSVIINELHHGSSTFRVTINQEASENEFCDSSYNYEGEVKLIHNQLHFILKGTTVIETIYAMFETINSPKRDPTMGLFLLKANDGSEKPISMRCVLSPTDLEWGAVRKMLGYKGFVKTRP